MCNTNKEILHEELLLSEVKKTLEELKIKLMHQAINQKEGSFEYEDKEVNAQRHKISTTSIYSNYIEKKTRKKSEFLAKFCLFMMKYYMIYNKPILTIKSHNYLKKLNGRRDTTTLPKEYPPEIELKRSRLSQILEDFNSLEISIINLHYLLKFLQEFFFKIQSLFFKKIANSYNIMLNLNQFSNKNKICIIDHIFVNQEYILFSSNTPRSSNTEMKTRTIGDSFQ